MKSKLDLVPVEKQPTHRPFRWDERMQLHLRLVRRQGDNFEDTIIGFNPQAGGLANGVGFEALCDGWVFCYGREDDGQPVGVLE